MFIHVTIVYVKQVKSNEFSAAMNLYEMLGLQTFNQWVAGSIPARLTTEINDLAEN